MPNDPATDPQTNQYQTNIRKAIFPTFLEEEHNDTVHL